MTEPIRDPLAELLNSPLERSKPARGEREPREPRAPSPWFPAIAAAVVGALIVAGGFAAGRSGATPATTTTTQNPTTTTTAPPAAAGFPADYVPVTELLAVRAERLAVRDSSLYVTFSVAALRSIDPTLSQPFDGGEWELGLVDGRTIASSGSVIESFTPGVFTVVFPADGYGVDEVSTARLTGRWIRSAAFPVQALEGVDVLPYSIDEPLTVDLDTNNRLLVDRLELADDGGTLEWRLDGDAAGAVVDLVVTLAEGFNDFSPAVMYPVSSNFGRFVPEFVPSISDQATSGSISLTSPGGLEPGTDLFRVETIWNVTWTTIRAADVVVPLDTAARG